MNPTPNQFPLTTIVEETVILLDATFEPGYAKKNPSLVASLVQAQVTLLTTTPAKQQ
jgi:hypothetical protein